MNKYTATQIIDITATFTNEAGSPVDPSTVTFKYDASNTNPATYTYSGSSTPGTGHIFRTAPGAYEVYLDTTSLLGYVVWSWPSLGTSQTVNSSSAIVYPIP